MRRNQSDGSLRRRRGKGGTRLWLAIVGAVCGLWLAACSAPAPAPAPATPAAATEAPAPTATAAPLVGATPIPVRTTFGPGTLFTYTVQTGDTVAAIAAHFNTSPAEVLAANPGLPPTATLSSGVTLTVPAYYFALGGPAFQIIPDSEFVNGPANKGFDLAPYIQSQPGFLRTQSAYAAQHQRTSAETIHLVAQEYSINPKLLVALLEWRAGALSQADVPPETIANPLGLPKNNTGFYLQTLWAAEQMSIGYYGWRSGTLTALTLKDGYRVRVDMYQNAATVGVEYLLAQLFGRDDFDKMSGPQGFAATYYRLWGNPYARGAPPQVIPGNLTQPALALPFASKEIWSLTGGPHPGWGTYLPWSALDFAPAGVSKCTQSNQWDTAVAPGLILPHADDNAVVLDLDGDGFEETGWVIFYFHVEARDQIAAGTRVNTGDPLGHPSCEGGLATGTHLHIARLYNGEWLPANGIVPGVVPFDLGGWTAQAGEVPYAGRLMRIGAWAEASTTTTEQNRIYWVP
jgi:LasA protease